MYADSIGRALERVEAFVVVLEIDASDAELERWNVEGLREAATAIRAGVSAMRAEALLAGEGRKRGRRRPVPVPPVSGTLPGAGPS